MKYASGPFTLDVGEVPAELEGMLQVILTDMDNVVDLCFDLSKRDLSKHIPNQPLTFSVDVIEARLLDSLTHIQAVIEQLNQQE